MWKTCDIIISIKVKKMVQSRNENGKKNILELRL